MSNNKTWKGATKYFKAAVATTLMASIGAAYTYDSVEAATNYNSDVQIEQSFNQHKVLAYNTFSDVRGNHLFFSDIEWATEFNTASGQPLMVGIGNGKFGPDNKLTEEQFATMIARFYDVKDTSNGSNSTSLGSWSDGVYSALAPYGVPLAGYKSKDKRDDPISRGQMAQIVAHIAGESSGLDNAVKYLFDTGITAGSHPNATSQLEKYGYKDTLTRGQAAAFFKRLHSKGLTNLDAGNVGSVDAGIISGSKAVDSRLTTTPVTPKPTQPPTGTISVSNPTLKSVIGIYESSGLPVKVISDNSNSYNITVGKDTHAVVYHSSGNKTYNLGTSGTQDTDSIDIAAKIVSNLTGESENLLINAATSVNNPGGSSKVIVGKVQVTWNQTINFKWK